MTKLKLAHTAVHNQVTESEHPRPFRTHYYYESEPKSRGSYARIGRAASELGAIVAATRHLLRNKYRHAAVYGEDGLRKFFLYRKGNTIRIIGYFGNIE